VKGTGEIKLRVQSKYRIQITLLFWCETSPNPTFGVDLLLQHKLLPLELEPTSGLHIWTKYFELGATFWGATWVGSHFV
jgi:hypothetical protein